MAQITLDPVAASAPEARHWVAACLDGLPDERRHTAALLVSELVTNAVLHAATSITVTARTNGEWMRVEVADGSPELPAPKDYGDEAATGRGLTVVSALADDWGTELDDEGKVVWFELGEPAGRAPARVHPSPAPGAARPGNLEDLADMMLAGVPVPLLVRAQAAYEELFREFRLIMERDPHGSSRAIQGRLLGLVDELGTRFAGFTTGAAETWRAAVARGDEEVDLRYFLPRAIGPVCRRYDALLDEAHEFCRSAALLTLAPAADVVALRKWVLGEFIRQAAGARPMVWRDSSWAARFAPHP